jgi:triosephosphate isomerase
MIRLWLEQRYGDEAQEIPILYGGSMTPANATEILSADHVNGGLIGGASLKANDFLAICRAGL